MIAPAALALALALAAACGGGGEPGADPAARGDAAVTDDDGGVVLGDAAVTEDDGTPADAGASAAVDPAERLRFARARAGKLAWDESIPALEQAAAAGDVAALEELAFQAVLVGDVARAEAAARQVIDHPDVPDVRRATAHYHLGRAAELRGDVDAARDAYTRAVALDPRATFTDRLAKLAPRPPLPAPAAPPCARPVPAAELCGCLHAATAPPPADPAAPPPRGACVTSHRHGGGASAITVVGRERSPTFLVATTGKTARALARLDADGDAGELTITGWVVARGAGGVPVVHVDAELGARDAAGKLRAARARSLVCALGAAPRCLAEVPTLARAGTASTLRRLAARLDASEERGVLRVTVTSGPTTPADVLGDHRLW